MATPKDYKDQGFNDKYGSEIERRLDAYPIGSNIDSDNPYGEMIYNSTKKQYQGGDYQDKYGSRLDSLYDAMGNREKFSYDVNSDPAYQAYRKQYLREGQRATQNTMAQASAMTGGRPSSYAVTAAAQQGNYYASQLTDKVPELYQQAYNRYLQEFQDKAQMAQTLQNAQNYEFNRYSTDRQFNYNAYNDRLQNMFKAREQALDIARYDKEFEYQQRQDAIRNMQNQQQTDWNMYNQNRNFGYGQYMDQISYEQQAKQNEWNEAKEAYEMGDPSKLKAMGIDTSKDVNAQIKQYEAKQMEQQIEQNKAQAKYTEAQAKYNEQLQQQQIRMNELSIAAQEKQMKSQEWQDQLTRAKEAANYGDYSQLKAMGFDTSKADFQDRMTLAQYYAQATGDVSYLKKLMY